MGINSYEYKHYYYACVMTMIKSMYAWVFLCNNLHTNPHIFKFVSSRDDFHKKRDKLSIKIQQQKQQCSWLLYFLLQGQGIDSHILILLFHMYTFYANHVANLFFALICVFAAAYELNSKFDGGSSTRCIWSVSKCTASERISQRKSYFRFLKTFRE